MPFPPSEDTLFRWLTIGLAILAGYIDAIGFLTLGGYFVSFMSGNSTQFAVGMNDLGAWRQAAIPFGIIVLFVVGVMAGHALRHFARRPSLAVLSLTTALLVAAAVAEELHLAMLAAPLLTLTMGAANNAFIREGEPTSSVTYVTGTLVKFGQHFAGWLLGQPKSDWRPFQHLWLGLVSGAILGAVFYGWWGLPAIWVAAGLAGGLTAVKWRHPPG